MTIYENEITVNFHENGCQYSYYDSLRQIVSKENNFEMSQINAFKFILETVKKIKKESSDYRDSDLYVTFLSYYNEYLWKSQGLVSKAQRRRRDRINYSQMQVHDYLRYHDNKTYEEIYEYLNNIEMFPRNMYGYEFNNMNLKAILSCAVGNGYIFKKDLIYSSY